MISVLTRPNVRTMLDSRRLRRRCHRLLRLLDLPDADLAVLLTDDEEIRALNRDYRAKDYATDVLSFSQMDGGVTPAPEELQVLGLFIGLLKGFFKTSSMGRSLSLYLRRLVDSPNFTRANAIVDQLPKAAGRIGEARGTFCGIVEKVYQ